MYELILGKSHIYAVGKNVIADLLGQMNLLVIGVLILEKRNIPALYARENS